MTTSALGVKPEAREAWVELSHALDEMGSPPACARWPELFFSDNAEDLKQAATACQWCPVRQLCDEFAVVNRERHGVWAGIDRARTKTKIN